ncbi:MAG: 50S ribosomal protein L19 [Oscillospiraceae bacterium]|jgi:large subunit ribosomal protein L19|nr:50S ribosomal protein L19 [Oscillospiraceae bacterium]
MDLLKEVCKESVKSNNFSFRVGDTVHADVSIREGNKSRIQSFEGVVIAHSGGGISETFTVRKISYGVGVERIFPLNCPNLKSVKVVRRGKVRRCKLYYLRDRVGRDAKVKQQVR